MGLPTDPHHMGLIFRNVGATQPGFTREGSSRTIRRRETSFSPEITQLYDSQEDYPVTVQHIFETPLDTLLSKRNNQLHNWLVTWRPVLDSDDESSLDSIV